MEKEAANWWRSWKMGAALLPKYGRLFFFFVGLCLSRLLN
jgi:hypothetical protein